MRKLIGHEPNFPKMIANLNHPMPVFDGIKVVRKDFDIDEVIKDFGDDHEIKFKLDNIGPRGFGGRLGELGGIQMVGRCMRPDGDMQQRIRMLPMPAQKIRILPDWDIIENGPAIGGNPFLRVKQLKARDNVGLAIKGKNLVFDMNGEFNKVVIEAKNHNGLKRLKAFWKDAQGDKAGIGYGHPALKGMFGVGGRVRPDRLQSRFAPEPFKIGMFGGGLGLFDDWNNLCAPMIHNPTPTNERLERRERRLRQDIERKAQEQERLREYKEQERIREQKQWDVCSYIRIKLSLVAKPGANVCQIIADVCAYSKSNGNIHFSLIGDELEKYGYIILGNGHFSRAYKGPDGSVYKVNSNNTSNDAWYVYAINAMYYGEHLACVPKIDAIAYRDKTYCVKMELLVPMKSIDFENCGSFSLAFIDKDVKSIMKALNLCQLDAEHMIELITRTKRETPGSRFDIHSDNVMHRIDADGNKTLVITDPLAYGDFIMSDFDERLAACNSVASIMPELQNAA